MPFSSISQFNPKPLQYPHPEQFNNVNYGTNESNQIHVPSSIKPFLLDQQPPFLNYNLYKRNIATNETTPNNQYIILNNTCNVPTNIQQNTLESANNYIRNQVEIVIHWAVNSFLSQKLTIDEAYNELNQARKVSGSLDTTESIIWIERKANLEAQILFSKIILQFNLGDYKRVNDLFKSIISIKNNARTFTINIEKGKKVVLSAVPYLDYFIAQILFKKGDYTDAIKLLEAIRIYTTEYLDDPKLNKIALYTNNLFVHTDWNLFLTRKKTVAEIKTALLKHVDYAEFLFNKKNDLSGYDIVNTIQSLIKSYLNNPKIDNIHLADEYAMFQGLNKKVI